MLYTIHGAPQVRVLTNRLRKSRRKFIEVKRRKKEEEEEEKVVGGNRWQGDSKFLWSTDEKVKDG
jgi:hypothetical protein